MESVANDPSDWLSVGTALHPKTFRPSSSASPSMTLAVSSGLSAGRNAIPAA